VGLDCYRERRYCPHLGVFLSRDPLLRLDVHPYLYVVARPIDLVDPSGRTVAFPISIVLASCCKEYYEATKNQDIPPVGATLCCLGVMITCTFSAVFSRYGITDAKAIELVKRCVREHERVHTKQITCSPVPLPPFRCITKVTPLTGYENENLRECLAFEAELGCLKRAMAECTSDSCRDQVDKHIRNFVEQALIRKSCMAILGRPIK